MWGESQYNVLVKQVEGCSDILTHVIAKIEPLVGSDAVANGLLQQLRVTVDRLDRRALRMLRLYDPAAAAMLKAGVKRDPRRRLFKSQAAEALDLDLAEKPPPRRRLISQSDAG